MHKFSFLHLCIHTSKIDTLWLLLTQSKHQKARPLAFHPKMAQNLFEQSQLTMPFCVVPILEQNTFTAANCYIWNHHLSVVIKNKSFSSTWKGCTCNELAWVSKNVKWWTVPLAWKQSFWLMRKGYYYLLIGGCFCWPQLSLIPVVIITILTWTPQLSKYTSQVWV